MTFKEWVFYKIKAMKDRPQMFGGKEAVELQLLGLVEVLYRHETTEPCPVERLVLDIYGGICQNDYKTGNRFISGIDELSYTDIAHANDKLLIILKDKHGIF